MENNKENIGGGWDDKSGVDLELVNDDFHPFPLKQSTDKIDRRRQSESNSRTGSTNGRILSESQNHSSLHFELSTSGLSNLGSLNLTPLPEALADLERSNLSIQAGLDISPPKNGRKDSFFSNYVLSGNERCSRQT